MIKETKRETKILRGRTIIIVCRTYCLDINYCNVIISVINELRGGCARAPRIQENEKRKEKEKE